MFEFRSRCNVKTVQQMEEEADSIQRHAHRGWSLLSWDLINAPSVNILEGTKDNQQKTLLTSLVGWAGQSSIHSGFDEMIAKVTALQKALQTLVSLNQSPRPPGKPFSNFAEISEESDQISAHYGVTGTAGDSTRVLELQRPAAAGLATSVGVHTWVQDPVDAVI
jgi:hypothetical protein